MGVSVTKPASEKWNSGDRYTFAVDVDGYEHTMYIMKRDQLFEADSYKKQVTDEVRDHREMLLKYKDTVHAEMDRLRSIGIECTHVMEGGGAQMQAFFSGKSGYIAIMYLGMKDGHEDGEPDWTWTCHMQQSKLFGLKVKDDFSKKTFYDGKVLQSDIDRVKK